MELDIVNFAVDSNEEIHSSDAVESQKQNEKIKRQNFNLSAQKVPSDISRIFLRE